MFVSMDLFEWKVNSKVNKYEIVLLPNVTSDDITKCIVSLSVTFGESLHDVERCVCTLEICSFELRFEVIYTLYIYKRK